MRLNNLESGKRMIRPGLRNGILGLRELAGMKAKEFH
jgi:hypothetical protein